MPVSLCVSCCLHRSFTSEVVNRTRIFSFGPHADHCPFLWPAKCVSSLEKPFTKTDRQYRPLKRCSSIKQPCLFTTVDWCVSSSGRKSGCTPVDGTELIKGDALNISPGLTCTLRTRGTQMLSLCSARRLCLQCCEGVGGRGSFLASTVLGCSPTNLLSLMGFFESRGL